MVNFRQVSEKDKSKFNQLATHPIQSWEWGEFRKKTGAQVLRLGIYKKGQLIQAFQLTIHKVPFTNYKIGVLLKGPKPTSKLLQALEQLGREQNLLFIRMEPNVIIANQKDRQYLTNLFLKNGVVQGKTSFTEETFIIDLTQSEKDLLAKMHQKTRYNIRLAKKRGVKVEIDGSQEAFERYLHLMAATIRRQNFYAHTETYHRLMWQTLKAKSSKSKANTLTAHLLTAKYQGKILAAWILFVFKKTLYYPYGASSNEHRNVMASNAIMWEAIRFGKKLGLKEFDLWGKEKGKGFTHFKEGFGPKTIEFIGTWDLPINKPLYYAFRVIETLRWIVLKSPIPFLKPTFRQK